MNEKNTSSSGYTLIEILVAITIIALIFGVGYVGFRDFSRRQLLTNAGRVIKSDLRLAQSKALAGQKTEDVSCTGANLLNSYEFRIVDSNTYKVYINCSGGNSEIKSNDLSTDLIIDSGTNPIYFKALGDGTNIPNLTETVTVTQISTGNKTSVSVSKGGEIN